MASADEEKRSRALRSPGFFCASCSQELASSAHRSPELLRAPAACEGRIESGSSTLRNILSSWRHLESRKNASDGCEVEKLFWNRFSESNMLRKRAPALPGFWSEKGDVLRESEAA